jgi:hypothetical protein
MSKLKVFLSYSFQDTAFRLALAGGLKETYFEVRWDTGQTHTPELHRAISGNLNWCDVVIPIITANWVNSHECREELVRANERRKLIIPFRHRQVSDDGPPKTPWYLRENLSVLWGEDELSRAIDDLVERLRTVPPEAWQPGSYRDLRIIGDDIQRSDSTPTWKAVLCQRVLSLAKAQLHSILVSDECVFPVAHEQAYLRFAEPIFGQAKTIIAICIASISTFWTNPDFSGDAGLYLKNQRLSADSICRLFVFDSVAEVMGFRSILQKHHETYGKQTGSHGVFICSTASYRRLLEKWLLEVDNGALRQDFGLLSFEDVSRKMHATLDKRQFCYTVYDDQDAAYISNRVIVEHFDALKTLGLGQFDPDSGVARWSPEWSQHNGQLAEALAYLFQDRPHPITHIVLLRPKTDTPEVAEYLQQLVSRFHKQRQALKISSVSVKRRSDLAVTDGRYSAPLLIWQDFDYVLIMEFEDELALKHYYQHELHSLERETLYILLNPDAKNSFEEASRLHRGQVQDRAAIFSEIERLMVMGRFILRIDAFTDNPLSYLIERLGR